MINLFYTCCMDFMATKPDNFYKVAIVDPEWGIGEDGGKDRGTYVTQKDGSKKFVKSAIHKKKNWDNSPADEKYFKELFRVSEHQIIWGINHFENFGNGRIVWDKCNYGSSQSNAEIAYNSLTNRIDIFRYMWRGMMQGKSIAEGHIQQGNKKLNEVKIHPTQKPVKLYKWILKTYIPQGWNILDTHRGSGSFNIACYDLGYSIDSCENDIDYHHSSLHWYQHHKTQCELKAKRSPELF